MENNGVRRLRRRYQAGVQASASRGWLQSQPQSEFILPQPALWVQRKERIRPMQVSCATAASPIQAKAKPSATRGAVAHKQPLADSNAHLGFDSPRLVACSCQLPPLCETINQFWWRW